jgi:vitamin B12 transporter
MKLSLTYFRTAYEQLIGFNSATSRYYNVGKAHTQGLEVGFHTPTAAHLSFNLSYNYLIAEDDLTGLPLLRRAKQQLSADLTYAVSDPFQVTLLGRYVGDRDDLNAITGVRLSMPSFTVLSLTTQYKYNEHARIFGRVDNLLNLSYQEVNGFGTPERSLFMGLSYAL